MYTCVRGLLRKRGSNQRMAAASVGTAKLRTLVEENEVAFLILTNPVVTGEVSLDLFSILPTVYAVSPDLTVNDWLVTLGNKSLPTTAVIPTAAVTRVKYNDAFAAGYKVERAHPTAGAGSQLPDAEYTDLLITKAGIDYGSFYRNILVTVNGLAHIADYSVKGVLVKGGGSSVHKANRHNIGLISFREVGEMTFLPIKPAMIKPRYSAYLRDGITLHVPGVDLSKKVVMVSIGGFIHFVGSNLKVVGDTSLYLDWAKIPLEDRYFNSEPLIDMTSYHATMVRNDDHGEALDLTQAGTNAAITAYLGLPQSFIILLDADNFYVERHQLERTGLPGRYYAYDRPDWPLQLDNGTLPAYVVMPEAGMYSVCVEKNLIPRLVSSTFDPPGANYNTGAQISQYPARYAAAWLLEMGKETIKTA